MNGTTLPQPAEEFLGRLARELRTMGARDAKELTEEVRSHITEALGSASDRDAKAADVVAGFGDARELAAAMLAERAEGESDIAAPAASSLARFMAWTADVVCAITPTALLWPFVIMFGAMLQASLVPLELLLAPPVLPATAALIGASVLAIGWPPAYIIRTVRNRRDGRPTIGTRSAGLTCVRTHGKTRWISNSHAPGAGVPPAPAVGRARLAVAAAVLLVATGSGWAVAASAMHAQAARTAQEDAHLSELRIQAYQASAQGWVRDAYAAALAGTMDSLLERGDRGFEVTAESAQMLRGFARSVMETNVRSWEFAKSQDQPDVTLDPTGDHSTVRIRVTESTYVSRRTMVFFFTVKDPQGASFGADQSWTLDALAADEQGMTTEPVQ